MRTKTLWTTLALLVTSLALVAAGCGGDDDEAGGTGATTAEGGAEAAEQVITVNWIGEPPSLDPGLASDTTSANILLNIMDPLVKLDDDSEPGAERGRELRDERGRQDGHVRPPRRLQVDERRPRHRAGLRVLVEADHLA